jgi:hypothetical protein
VLADGATFLLAAVLAVAFVALVALTAVAAAAAWWSLRGLLARLRADRRLETLRERHHDDVRGRAGRLVELDAVEFGDWPVLDEEPPVVFPRRRAA